MGHRGTLGVDDGGDARSSYPKAGGRASRPFWALQPTTRRRIDAVREYRSAPYCATFAGDGALRRAEGGLPAPRRRGLHHRSPPDVRALVCAAPLTATRTRCARAARSGSCAIVQGRRRALPRRRDLRGGDWAARHDRYATPLHGRHEGRAGRADGAGTARTRRSSGASLPRGAGRVARHRRRGLRRAADVFDDWGMFALHQRGARPWMDIPERRSTSDIWEQELERTRGLGRCGLTPKRAIAQVTVDHGGSITARAMAPARAGEVDVVPAELGGAL